MGIAGISNASITGDEYQQAGAAIGTGIGVFMIGVIWFLVTISALIAGLLLKKGSIVEKGPTGSLATLGEEDYKITDLVDMVSDVAHTGVDKVKELNDEGKFDPHKITDEISSVANRSIKKVKDVIDANTAGIEDPYEKLEKLAGLKEKGIISADEFNEEKKKILVSTVNG